MTKLMKMSLVSAVLATGAMAAETTITATIQDMDGIDIMAGHTLTINVSDTASENIMYNGGVIQKVTNPNDAAATAATITTTKTNGATIYNLYAAAEDEGRLENTTKLKDGKTFKEVAVELLGDCVYCNSSGHNCYHDGGDLTYVPKDVYTVKGRGTVVTMGDNAVTLDTKVAVKNAGVLESLKLTKNNIDPNIIGDHRLFNLVSTTENTTIDYTGEFISSKYYEDFNEGLALVSIPTTDEEYATNFNFNHLFPLVPFRGLDQINYITGDITGTNYTEADVTMQGEFIARPDDNGACKVTFNATGVDAANNDLSPTKVTFAKNVDVSAATAATFKGGTFVFKGKLKI